MSNGTAKWSRTRKQWIIDHPEDFNGFWYCVVGGGALTVDRERLDYGALWLTLDHDISRSRDPSKKHDDSNLKPMCNFHNVNKGSRSLREYLQSKPRLRCGS